jgi:hypothetical protein
MTGVPDPKEVSEMARLIRMMNEGIDFDEPEIVNESTTTSEGVIRLADMDPSVAAMKNILEIFQNGGGAEPLVERAQHDRELREALITEQTERGTRIGSWEIISHEDARGLKTFDVTNIHTSEPIATDLTLYDAAHGICRALNEGHVINSHRIRDILASEFDYARARQNAAEFREKAVIYEANNNPRRALMEDRFQEALGRAREAREKVSKLAKL